MVVTRGRRGCDHSCVQKLVAHEIINAINNFTDTLWKSVLARFQVTHPPKLYGTENVNVYETRLKR